MNRGFERCLKGRSIVRQDFTERLIPAELEAAKKDLERAKASLNEDNSKWATIQAYYTILHAARALLFAKGYREKSHNCLKVAIQALYVDEGLLNQKFVDDFDMTMLLRETADYRSDLSQSGAKSSIESAARFLTRAGELLGTDASLAAEPWSKKEYTAFRPKLEKLSREELAELAERTGVRFDEPDKVSKEEFLLVLDETNPQKLKSEYQRMTRTR